MTGVNVLLGLIQNFSYRRKLFKFLITLKQKRKFLRTISVLAKCSKNNHRKITKISQNIKDTMD